MNASQTSGVLHVLLRTLFELHDNSGMMKSGAHVVGLGMSSIAQLRANPCLSQSQMCCSGSMCRPCEQQRWAAARPSALLTDTTVRSVTCGVIKLSKEPHFITGAQAHERNVHTERMHSCTCSDTNGTSHWEAHWNMNTIICFSPALFSSLLR